MEKKRLEALMDKKRLEALEDVLGQVLDYVNRL